MGFTEMICKCIVNSTIASVALFSSSAFAQELPSGATWSTKSPPHGTVLETFTALQSTHLDRYQVSKDHSFLHIASWDEGPLQGNWQFSGGNFEIAPTRYLMYRRIPGEPPKLEISWACEETPESCKKFRDEIPSMLPPIPPPLPAIPPPDSTREAILHEACKPKKPSQLVTYPKELMGTGVSGRVELVITVNPCGEVKRAEIFQTSGNPFLDAAALKDAQQWVISPERIGLEKGRGIFMRAPVEYDPR